MHTRSFVIGAVLWMLWSCSQQARPPEIAWHTGDFAAVRATAGERPILTFFFTDW